MEGTLRRAGKRPWGTMCEPMPGDGIRIPLQGTGRAKSWEEESPGDRGLRGGRQREVAWREQGMVAVGREEAGGRECHRAGPPRDGLCLDHFTQEVATGSCAS